MQEPPAACLAVATGSGCSSTCHISSEEFEPVALWLSRKNAELFIPVPSFLDAQEMAMLPKEAFSGCPSCTCHALCCGMLLPVSPSQQCSVRWALGTCCLPIQTLVHSGLQAGSRHVSSCHACPVPSTHQDDSTLLAPLGHLGGQSDHCINFLMIVAPVPVS